MVFEAPIGERAVVLNAQGVFRSLACVRSEEIILSLNTLDLQPMLPQIPQLAHRSMAECTSLSRVHVLV